MLVTAKRMAGARGVPARCALAVRSPRFARRAFCASLFSSPRSTRAASSLRSPPRRRHHHHERLSGACDVRLATRAARGESVGIPLSFVVARRPRGCVLGLFALGWPVASLRAPPCLFSRADTAACEKRACGVYAASTSPSCEWRLVACVAVGACVELAGANCVELSQNAWSWAKSAWSWAKTRGVKQNQLELAKHT